MLKNNTILSKQDQILKCVACPVEDCYGLLKKNDLGKYYTYVCCFNINFYSHV